MPDALKRHVRAALLVAAMQAPPLLAGGGSLVFADAQEALGLPVADVATNAVSATDGTNTVVFHPGYRRVLVNGIAVWLNEPAESDFLQVLRVSSNDVARLLTPILQSQSADPGPQSADAGPATSDACSPSNSPTVFIDPGHGGEDSGAISAGGLKEKDFVLDVSRRIAALLEDDCFNVVLSRTNDTFVSLEKRSALAAESGAGIFVSVHANTTGNKGAKGVETFSLAFAGSDSTTGDTRISKKTWPGNAHDAGSSALGYFIHSSVNTARGDADRGFRHARFQVLRQAPCPAVLVECGFLSNGPEVLSFGSDRYRQRMASGIASGIRKYAAAAAAGRIPLARSHEDSESHSISNAPSLRVEEPAERADGEAEEDGQ